MNTTVRWWKKFSFCSKILHKSKTSSPLYKSQCVHTDMQKGSFIILTIILVNSEGPNRTTGTYRDVGSSPHQLLSYIFTLSPSGGGVNRKGGKSYPPHMLVPYKIFYIPVALSACTISCFLCKTAHFQFDDQIRDSQPFFSTLELAQS